MLNRKLILWIAGIALVSVFAAVIFLGGADVPTVASRSTEAPQPTKVASPTSEPTQAAHASPEATQPARPKRRPLAIMIENHPDSRPQSGLHLADVVYEAPAEFGIPRFLAIWVNRDTDFLGPVRSARTYYLAWASEYDPVFVHAGGSPQSRSWIKQLEIDDVDAIYGRVAQGAFRRTTDRQAPHNLYMDTEKLREENKEFQDAQGSWGGLTFSDRASRGARGGTEVTVTYEGGYKVTYKYDPTSRVYKRYMDGQPHLDRETKRHLGASTLIVQSVGMWKIKDDPYGRLEAKVQGSNDVLVFQNGEVIKGTWEKDKRDTPTIYRTQDGQNISVKPGQVWIQIVPLKGTKIDY